MSEVLEVINKYCGTADVRSGQDSSSSFNHGSGRQNFETMLDLSRASENNWEILQVDFRVRILPASLKQSSSQQSGEDSPIPVGLLLSPVCY